MNLITADKRVILACFVDEHRVFVSTAIVLRTMVVRQQAFHIDARELALVQIHLHVLEFGLVKQL